MTGSILQFMWYVFAGGVPGIVVGLLLMHVLKNRQIERLESSYQKKLHILSRERDHFATGINRARSAVESLRTTLAEAHTELESSAKKSKKLAKNVLALRAEREETKHKVGTLQNALLSLKERTTTLQNEFDKVGEFYKGELVKSFEKRKALEAELEEAREEHESFAKLVESSVLEHGSPEEMIVAAQLRLGQLEVLERNVSKLEAENAQLRDEAVKIKREYNELSGDLAELEELRVNNRQLVRCVESLEDSRQQHERDADLHRDRADQSEQLSETLRLKLGDLEKNFADIEEQQQQAIKRVRKATTDAESGTGKNRERDREADAAPRRASAR